MFHIQTFIWKRKVLFELTKGILFRMWQNCRLLMLQRIKNQNLIVCMRSLKWIRKQTQIITKFSVITQIWFDVLIKTHRICDQAFWDGQSLGDNSCQYSYSSLTFIPLTSFEEKTVYCRVTSFTENGKWRENASKIEISSMSICLSTR